MNFKIKDISEEINDMTVECDCRPRIGETLLIKYNGKDFIRTVVDVEHEIRVSNWYGSIDKIPVICLTEKK